MKVIVNDPKPGSKVSEQGFKALLIGYPPSGKGWIFFRPLSGKVFQYWAAVFPQFQNYPIFKVTEKRGSIGHKLNSLEMRLGQILADKIAAKEDKMLSGIVLTQDMQISTSFEAEMKGNMANKWRQACNRQLEQMKKLEVWEEIKKEKGLNSYFT